MAKEKEIDRLTVEANEALALGMSYGKYKAMQKAEPLPKKPPRIIVRRPQGYGLPPGA